MQIKQLEKAAKVLQYIKELDDEIIRLEAFAMQAANDDIDVNLKLDIIDLKKKDEEDNKVQPDGKSSLNLINHYNEMRAVHYHSMFNFWSPPGSEKKDESLKIEYSRSISNNSALQILGVLLFELQTKRLQLIIKLEAMGVAIT